MKNILLFAFILVLGNSCATTALKGFIEEKEEVAREWEQVTLKGRFSGEVSLNHIYYDKYEFCGFKNDPHRILELWKPRGEGEVLLREHRDYQLSGELPIIMETGFGLLTKFKRGLYRRVTFEGELINDETIANGVPQFQLNRQQELPRPPQLNFVQPDNPGQKPLEVEHLERFKGFGFARPQASGEKWYLMTTRVKEMLLGGRTGTRYFLSTAKQRYKVDASSIHYDERSWSSNKLMRGGYVVSVPVDIISVPFIFLGVGAIGLYKSIF